MRRVGITLTAGAALVLALVVPTTMAEATSKSAGTTAQNTEISAQGAGHDDEFSGQHKRGKRDRHHQGYRHGRHRHHDYYYRGGRCYGCYGPGSECDRYGCYYHGHPYYYGGGYYGHPYYGGYGCNYDYPCSSSGQTYDCTRYRGPDGKPTGDPHCRYDARCDCWYHTSDRTPQESQTQPAPDSNGQPAPDQSAQPAPEQSRPAPDRSAQPSPDGGTADQGSEPRPY